jgi:hypothetical protein
VGRDQSDVVETRVQLAERPSATGWMADEAEPEARRPVEQGTDLAESMNGMKSRTPV